MQMTPSPIKHGNADLNKLITGIGTTMDPFHTDFGDYMTFEMKSSLHFTGKMIYGNIAGSILATQTQLQQW